MTVLNLSMAAKPGDKNHWGELQAAGRALAIAEAACQFDGLSVLVTETAREAAAQGRALKFFTAEQGLEILSFPDWETLPYDIFSPHQDIVSARLQTLANLPHTKQALLIVPAANADASPGADRLYCLANLLLSSRRRSRSRST